MAFLGQLSDTKSTQHQLIKRLSLLFHLNCPSNLKCTNCIGYIANEQVLHYLHAASIEAFKILISYDGIANNFLIQQDVFAHMSPNIISLADQHQQYISLHRKSNKEDRNLSCCFTSHQQAAVSVSISLFQNVQQYDNGIQDNFFAVPNLIESILCLTQYQRNNHIDLTDGNYTEQNDYMESQTNVRQISLNFIYWMIRYSYPNNLIQLVQIPNFVSIVTSGSGTAGGSEEEQYIVIYYSLMTIIYFYKRYQENNFDPQRTILKPFEEEIEESGQIEEAEAQMFISRKYYNENGTVISDKALECMREIINAYIDDTNLPVWMRHRH